MEAAKWTWQSEGARSFNELYQLVVTCEQPLGAERAKGERGTVRVEVSFISSLSQSRTKGERGTVRVEV